MRNHSWFASDSTRELLAANGLCDFAAAFQLGEPLDAMHEGRATRHDNKRVVKLDIAGPKGQERLFIKRQWQRERWLPRFTDLRHHIGVKCSPIHELQGLRILKDAGFNVAEPLALFWQGMGFSRGAIVTRAVPPEKSLSDLIDTGEFDEMPASQRDAIILASSQVVARLHQERISWRSMKAKHFYPEQTSPGKWRIWLIDCEGVYKRATRHDCQRELSVFLQYIAGHAPRLGEAFMAAYAVWIATL